MHIGNLDTLRSKVGSNQINIINVTFAARQSFVFDLISILSVLALNHSYTYLVQALNLLMVMTIHVVG